MELCTIRFQYSRKWYPGDKYTRGPSEISVDVCNACERIEYDCVEYLENALKVKWKHN